MFPVEVSVYGTDFPCSSKCRSPRLEMPYLLRKPKDHYLLRNIPLASPNLGQMNPVPTHDLFESSSNITSGTGIATVVVDISQGFRREAWGKKPLGRARRRWEDDIKIDVQEIILGSLDCIDLARDRDRWRTFLKTVMNQSFLFTNNAQVIVLKQY